MALATATRSAYTFALREVYTPKLWNLQNRDRIMLQILNKDKANYAEGAKIHIRLHTAGTGAVVWSDAGTLPTSGSQKVEEATLNYKRLYGRMEIDGALIESSRTPTSAEMRSLLFEAKHLVEDLADALAYDIWQDGSGKLGGVVTAHSTPAAGNFTINIANCGLKRQMQIAIEGAGTDDDADLHIESIIRKTATTFEVITTGQDNGDGTYDDGSGYYAYRTGMEASPTDVITGVRKWLADDPTSGTLGGINRATAANAFWRNQYMGNSGTNREVTLTLIQEMVDRIETNSPGTAKLIVCSHALWRKVARILVPDKRYGGDVQTLKGWCKAVMFNDTPIVRDKYCPANHMYFFDTDTWTIYHNSEGGFIDTDGQVLHWKVGFDKYEAAWKRYIELACHDPASNGVIFDLAE